MWSFMAAIRLSISSSIRVFIAGVNSVLANSMPESFAEIAVGRLDARLPSRLLFLLTAEYLRKKLKFSSTKGFGSDEADALTIIQRQICFPVRRSARP